MSDVWKYRMKLVFSRLQSAKFKIISTKSQLEIDSVDMMYIDDPLICMASKTDAFFFTISRIWMKYFCAVRYKLAH